MFRILFSLMVAALLAACASNSQPPAKGRKHYRSTNDRLAQVTTAGGYRETLVFRGEKAKAIPQDVVDAVGELHALQHDCYADSSGYYTKLQQVGQQTAVREIIALKGKISAAKYNEVATKFDNSMVGGRMLISSAIAAKLTKKQSELKQKAEEAKAYRDRLVRVLQRNGIEVFRLIGDRELPLL